MLPGFYEKTVVNIIGLQDKNTRQKARQKMKMNEKIVKARLNSYQISAVQFAMASLFPTTRNIFFCLDSMMLVHHRVTHAQYLFLLVHIYTPGLGCLKGG